MSLLMKALKKVERGPQGEGGAGGWSLEPMERTSEPGATGVATPRSAQAAADLIRARETSREGTRLAILLGALVVIVVGMGAYFYVAVYMPWLLLPKPSAAAPALPASSAPAVQPSSPAPSAAIETLPPMAPESVPERAAPDVAAPRQAFPETRSAAAATAPARALNEAPTRDQTPARLVIRRDRLPQHGDAQAPTLSGASAATSKSTSGDDIAAAYELLQAGHYEQARQAYEKLRAAQPDNPDVLLGLAVIAQNQNRSEQAAQLYLRVIERDPRNGYAQAGLVGLIGRADPAAAEAKLKQLIAQQPAAYLQFALGNLYAAQGRWSEAQAAYFEAQRLEPDSADYAFNLAVSLEHVKQPRAAAEYYQRALRLAQGGGAVHFDPGQARNRLQQLSR